MKLDPTKHEYDQQFGWVAHGNSLNEHGHLHETQPAVYEEMKKLVANRYKLEILGGVEDSDASYSYDDWALVRLGKKYYLLSTSGCSCPSPSETWRIEKGPATLAQIRKHVVNGDYAGYTVPGKQMDEFIALIDEAQRKESK